MNIFSIKRVTITVSGDLPEDISNEELIGKTIEYKDEHAYVAIAHGVSISSES